MLPSLEYIIATVSMSSHCSVCFLCLFCICSSVVSLLVRACVRWKISLRAVLNKIRMKHSQVSIPEHRVEEIVGFKVGWSCQHQLNYLSHQMKYLSLQQLRSFSQV